MPYIYHIDPKFLTDMTIPENAYTLGRLWADGHVNRDTVTLHAVHGDVEHLIPFLKSMGVGAIYTRQRTRNGRIFGRPSYAIEINNRKLCAFLIDLGFKEKSKIAPIKVLDAIPTNLHVLFWRGFMDGDGSIYTGKSPKLTFWGSENQDWSVLIRVIEMLGISWSITKYARKGGKHKSSCINIRQIAGMARFCEWLYMSYTTDQIGMPRKWLKAQEMIKRGSQSRSKIHLQPTISRLYLSDI